MTRRKPKRRRSNPGGVPVLFANPRRRTRRSKARAPARRRRRVRRRSNPVQTELFGGGAARRAPAKRKRRRKHTRWNSVSSHERRTNPRLRRRRRTMMRMSSHRRRRRSNPMNFGKAADMLKVARIGVAGALGIVSARISKTLYLRHVAPMVVGGAPASWRGMLSEALEVAAMAGVVYGVEMASRKVRMLSPMDRMAYQIGGFAEAGRYAIGKIVKRLRPTTDLARVGLDGALGAGYEYSPELMGGEYEYEYMGGEVTDLDNFLGEGELENIEAFHGLAGAELEHIDNFGCASDGMGSAGQMGAREDSIYGVSQFMP